MIGAIQKNTRERIEVSWGDFRGHTFVDVRLYFTKDDGASYGPTPKGVTIRPAQLGDLIRLLQTAEIDAKARGLIGVGGGE